MGERGIGLRTVLPCVAVNLCETARVAFAVRSRLSHAPHAVRGHARRGIPVGRFAFQPTVAASAFVALRRALPAGRWALVVECTCGIMQAENEAENEETH